MRGALESVRPRARIAAIIPTLDEEGAIGSVLAAMPPEWIDQIIVVDGGSRDGTVAEARSAGATVLVERERGYGRACAKGAAAAVAEGAEVLVFLDGDGGDRPEAIPSLVQPVIKGDYDFVIGSRTRGPREEAGIGAHQKLAGRTIGAALGLLYGVRYTDMCAFRAIRAEALRSLGMREMTYGWNLEMQMRVAASGLRSMEIPVDHRRRRGGESKVSGKLVAGLKAAWTITTTFLRLAATLRRDAVDTRHGSLAGGR
jgi:glycosyltransferase involved in cell wall biosynthesis